MLLKTVILACLWETEYKKEKSRGTGVNKITYLGIFSEVDFSDYFQKKVNVLKKHICQFLDF